MFIGAYRRVSLAGDVHGETAGNVGAMLAAGVSVGKAARLEQAVVGLHGERG